MADPVAGATTTDSTSTTNQNTVDAGKTAEAAKPNPSETGGDEATIVTDGTEKGKGTTQAEKKPDAAKTGNAPEKYEPFKVPEGFPVDETAKISEWARANDLPQEKAQAAVDLVASTMAQNQKSIGEAFLNLKKEWYDQSMKMLGPNAKAEEVHIARGRNAYFDEEAVQILKESGVGNHPAIVRAFIKMGKAVADDTVVDGGKGGGGEKTRAEILYPNLPK